MNGKDEEQEELDVDRPKMGCGDREDKEIDRVAGEEIEKRKNSELSRHSKSKTINSIASGPPKDAR